MVQAAQSVPSEPQSHMANPHIQKISLEEEQFTRLLAKSATFAGVFITMILALIYILNTFIPTLQNLLQKLH